MFAKADKSRNYYKIPKDQENPNFSAFGTLGSLSNDPVFDPGRLGKRSDGTKITKLQQEVERVKKNSLYGKCTQNQIDAKI